jgi:SAM-dependent methyltransferase
MADVGTRWQHTAEGSGEHYDQRWQELAAAGHNIHGEADLVESLLGGAVGKRVLDAGCGTGRVAIELAARGMDVTGVDADEHMLATARAKAPQLSWRTADLADWDAPDDAAGEPFDLVLLAGNVMIFLAAGTEGRVLANLTGRLRPGGLLASGFSLHPGGLTLRGYDRLAARAGLKPVARWATWEKQPYSGGDYAVSVHRR